MRCSPSDVERIAPFRPSVKYSPSDVEGVGRSVNLGLIKVLELCLCRDAILNHLDKCDNL